MSNLILRTLLLVAAALVVSVGCSDEPDRPRSGSSVWENARDRGILFRGVGQEPGWVVEIGPDSVSYSGNYGRRRLSISRSAMSLDTTEASVKYRSDRIEVVVDDASCTDVMSGESFTHTVRVSVGNDTYRGCGRYLE